MCVSRIKSPFKSIQTCDRKGTLLFNNIFSIVPAVMMGVSEIAKSYEIIIVARFIVGICAGGKEAIATSSMRRWWFTVVFFVCRSVVQRGAHVPGRTGS